MIHHIVNMFSSIVKTARPSWIPFTKPWSVEMVNVKALNYGL